MTEHSHHTTHHHKQPQENGLAVAAFVLGIVSFTGFGALTGIPAIITGYMSLKNPVNKSLGIAGLIMGIVVTAFTLLIVLLFALAMILALATSEVPAASTPHDNSSATTHSRNI